MNNASGGKGGDATVEGNNSAAEGGGGGKGGVGPGGPGGDAFVKGDNAFARGGDGGNSGTRDGRGGRSTKSQGEILGMPTALWGYGMGGRGANAVEYDRRLQLLIRIRTEWMQKFADDAVFVEAGIDQIPIAWINTRLSELAEDWKVEQGPEGYVMPDLP